MSFSLKSFTFFWDYKRGFLSKIKLLMSKKPAKYDVNNRSKDFMVFFKSAIVIWILTNFDTPNKMQTIPFEIKMHEMNGYL